MKPNHKILIAGLAIIVGSNLVALGGVAYNRAGEPDALVDLTERELSMPYRYGMARESTGLGLQINCRIENTQSIGYNYANCWGSPDWLDRSKLIQLGFKLSASNVKASERWAYDRELPRKAYLVLEYDGAAYQRTLAKAESDLADEQALQVANPGKEEFEQRVERAQKILHAEQQANSRLFAIDAGLDKTALRATYPDNSQYILMQALIRPRWNSYQGKQQWEGSIDDLLIDRINIPLNQRAVFTPLEADPRRDLQDDKSPRYSVRVAFGKRAEPWVVGVGEM